MISFRRPSRPVRVLLVEDNDIYAHTVEFLLEGLESVLVVGRARNGAEGVELALALSPECVLMDVSMPVMDGFEATERIRETLPSARVVMLTSSDDPADRARARAAGAQGYLMKDSRLPEMEAAVTGSVAARPVEGVYRASVAVASA